MSGSPDAGSEPDFSVFGPEDDVLSRLVDDGPFGLVITDDLGVVVWLNGTLEKWLGYAPADLIGRRTFQDLLAPGGRIYFDTHLRPLLHLRQEVTEIALDVVRSDGTRLSALVNFRFRERLDSTGGLVEIIVFDATERRSYESELLHAQRMAVRSEALLQVMYDIASGMAAAVTVDDIVTVVAQQGSASISGAQCALWLFDEERQLVVRAGNPGDGSTVPAVIEVPERSPALQQLAGGAMLVIADHATSQHEYPLVCDWMARSGIRSATIAPLVAEGVLVGALSYGFEEAHEFEPSELRAASALATLTEQALRRAWLVNSELRGKRRLEVLLDFTSRLSGALSLDSVLDVIVASSHELLGAVGVRLALLDETKSNLEFVRGTGIGGRLGLLIPIEWRSIACTAVRSGALQVASSRKEVEERFPDSPILSDPHFGRCVTVPLRRGSEVLGSWVLAFADPGAPDVEDVKLIELFAAQAAQATQRAKSHTDEVVAREQADVRRLISEALNRSVTTSKVAQVVTREGRNAFDAAGLVVFVVDAGNPSLLLVESEVGLDHATVTSTARIDEVQRRCGLSSWTSPRFLTTPNVVDESVGVLVEASKWAAAAVLPLGLAGTELGVILIGFDHEDALTNSTRVTLSGLAGEASVALARARRFDVEHEIAVTLQRSILPTVDVTDPSWSVSTWHQPTSGMMVGGDLFDLTELDDGRLILVVADVVGHGLQAAAAMGALRAAAKALALVSARPAEVIAGLHAFAAATPGVFCASVCCVEVRPDGSGRYSCAGHPFPVLRHSEGATELLYGGRSALLGIEGAVASDAEFFMTEGSTLVVYTDGLVERRERGTRDEISRLRNFVGTAFPGAAAQHVVEHMLGDRHVEDDAVVVCVSRTN